MLSMTTPIVTPADATDYLDDAGAVGWPVDEALQAQAIMRGQRAIASRYNFRWLPPAWDEIIPDQIRFAVIEAARIEAVTPGFFSRTYTPSEAKVLTGAGQISWTVVGGKGKDAMVPTSTVIEALLAGFVRPATGGTTWLKRA